jgi:hypothetical protein
MSIGRTLGVGEGTVGTTIEGFESIGEAHAPTSQIATRAERFIEGNDAGPRASVTAS